RLDLRKPVREIPSVGGAALEHEIAEFLTCVATAELVAHLHHFANAITGEDGQLGLRIPGLPAKIAIGGMPKSIVELRTNQQLPTNLISYGATVFPNRLHASG